MSFVGVSAPHYSWKFDWFRRIIMGWPYLLVKSEPPSNKNQQKPATIHGFSSKSTWPGKKLAFIHPPKIAMRLLERPVKIADSTRKTMTQYCSHPSVSVLWCLPVRLFPSAITVFTKFIKNGTIYSTRQRNTIFICANIQENITLLTLFQTTWEITGFFLTYINLTTELLYFFLFTYRMIYFNNIDTLFSSSIYFITIKHIG